jgi:predicted dehydrogenase/threonine dehydrogenase-like Zn-dependent dehydrogenase
MKQIFKVNSEIKLLEVPLPTINNNEILVAVQSSVISTGTETMDMKQLSISEKYEEKVRLANKLLDIYKENGLSFTFEALKNKLSSREQDLLLNPIGYSNAGVVVAKGTHVRNFNIGDRVACAGSGIAAHAEYVSIPVNLACKVPEDIILEDAAFTTIGAIAMHGIRRTEVSFGETLVIVGIGLIGLLAVQIAKAWGLVVIGVDLNESKLDLAKKLGADSCFRPDDPRLMETILNLTNGNGADAVIIYAATKSSEPVNQAFRMCRRKGRVVAVGAIGMELNRDEMYMKEIDFIMSTSYGPGRYDINYEMKGIDYPIGYVRWTENRNMIEFVRLLNERKIDVQSLISNKFGIEQAVEAYKSLVDHSQNHVANIFNYKHEVKKEVINRTILYPKANSANKIRVGIIGAGSFIQTNHLANLLKMPDKYELVAIANGTSGGAKSVGEKYKCNYVTTDYHELLNDKNINTIIIGTRHNLHAQQVIDSIKAGKNVLVEKPLAITLKEIELIKQAHHENPNVKVTVGFNRRYSTLVQQLKKEISKEAEPIAINCRINAGYFPPDAWFHDMEVGGGRIIGEACHFIDLVTYLADSEITDICAHGMPLNQKSINSQDNLACSIAFKNGSIATMVYSSIGGKSMEKERIEILTNKSSYVIDDFCQLLTYNSKLSSIVLKEQDKGHAQLIREFEKLMHNEESLILPFEHDIRISQLTIELVMKLNNLL